MSTTVVLPSGAELIVNIAPLSSSNKLKKSVARELLAINIDIGKIDPALFEQELTPANLAKLDPKVLNTFKSIVLSLVQSDAVELAFYECAARCTIDGQAITKGNAQVENTFEPESMRGDFHATAWEVMVSNLGPFIAPLFSKSSTREQEPKKNPVSA